jgi:hypothetical protein
MVTKSCTMMVTISAHFVLVRCIQMLSFLEGNIVNEYEELLGEVADVACMSDEVREAGSPDGAGSAQIRHPTAGVHGVAYRGAADSALCSDQTQAGGDGGGSPNCLRLAGLDAWGQLLVQGLADFYELAVSAVAAAQSNNCDPAASSRCAMGGMSPPARPSVIALLTTVRETEQEGEGAGGESTRSGAAQQGCREQGDDAEGTVTLVLRHRRRAAGQGSQSAPTAPPMVTCGDVLHALAAEGTGSLSARRLAAYLRAHVHGSEASSVVHVDDGYMRAHVHDSETSSLAHVDNSDAHDGRVFGDALPAKNPGEADGARSLSLESSGKAQDWMLV